MLKKLCEAYIWIVDHYPNEQSRSIVHDLVMAAFDDIGLKYADRQEAAMLARWLATDGQLEVVV